MTHSSDRAVSANPAVAPSQPADRGAPARPSPLGRFFASFAHRAWSSAWTLLVLTNLFWAGNIVIGRAVAGHVPPVTLAYWRWTGAFLVAFGFAWPHLKRDWPELLRHWPMLLLLAATGIATYNTMSYIGLQYTTALNALLLQSAMPVIVLLWDFGLFGARPSLWQTLGVALSLLGVLAIVSQLSLAGAYLHQYRRSLAVGRTGGHRALYAAVAPAAGGASVEPSGDDDGHRLLHDPAVLSVGGR
jgi:drug/metabolite transporter (DMT)-like permease